MWCRCGRALFPLWRLSFRVARRNLPALRHISITTPAYCPCDGAAPRSVLSDSGPQRRDLGTQPDQRSESMRRTFTLLATGALLIASIAVAVAAGAKAGHSSQGDRGPMREGVAGNDWGDDGPRGPHGPGEGHRSWERDMLMGPEGRLL